MGMNGKPSEENASPARVVLLCGISGSGKTHYARTLEAQGYRRLSLDRLVWDRYGPLPDELPLSGRREIFRKAAAAMAEELGRMLDSDPELRIVVDAPLCKRAGRDRLRAVCRDRGVTSGLVYLSAPPEELRRRLAARTGSGPDDQRVPESDLVAFLRDFEPPQEE